jgi:hypothetical protein
LDRRRSPVGLPRERLGSSRILRAKPDNEALAAPKLYIVRANKPLGLGHGLMVVVAREPFATCEMPVVTDDVRPIFSHP